jgi:hypothetical protein
MNSKVIKSRTEVTSPRGNNQSLPFQNTVPEIPIEKTNKKEI